MGAPVFIYTAPFRGGRQSEDLLITAARAWCASMGRGQIDLSVTRPEYGKPYFQNAPDICFSVTHSGDFWLCAISEQVVGLDLQQIRETKPLKIARRFFHSDEADYLEHHPGDFFTVWTAKESYVKLTGRGIDDWFSDFSVISGGAPRTEMDGASFRFLPFVPGYVLCLCCGDTSDVRISEIAQT